MDKIVTSLTKMYKIKRSDFGFEWKIKKQELKNSTMRNKLVKTESYFALSK